VRRLFEVGQFLPSWWLVQASHVALNGHGWSARGWITVAAWTAILSAGAAWAYRRDTNRVWEPRAAEEASIDTPPPIAGPTESVVTR
jgi:hypothetical protein